MSQATVAPAVEVTLVSGPTTEGDIDTFELLHARRALKRYRAHLGRQGRLDLVAADVAEGNAALRRYAQASEGRFTSGTTILRVRGIRAQQFLTWMNAAFSADEEVLLSAEPEHFAMIGQEDGTFTVVENLGPYVCSFSMGGWTPQLEPWAEVADELLPADTFPFKMSSDLILEDETVIGRALTQFGDTEDGLMAHLTISMPAEAPAEVLEHHLQHFSVEFKNWFIAAGADTSR